MRALAGTPRADRYHGGFFLFTMPVPFQPSSFIGSSFSAQGSTLKCPCFAVGRSCAFFLVDACSTRSDRLLANDDRLLSDRFPRSSKYHPDWIISCDLRILGVIPG